MKIQIITLHCTDNCGSTLQTMALQDYLRNQNNEVEVIDYRPKYLQYNGNVLKTLAKRVLLWKESINQARKNKAFQNTHLVVTHDCYKSYEALKHNPPQADIYIAGSDQIWNPSYLCGQDASYYLEFVEDPKKKYAYAASVGKDDLNSEEKEQISARVRDFAEISVREASSQAFLQQRLERKVEYVCDPVFLLNRENYEKILRPANRKEKYILVYLVQPSRLLDSLLAELKKRYNAKVLLIYGVRKNCVCDEHIIDVSPDEFLGYIRDAEYVVASSFHATAFSHIFEKDFAVVLPQRNTSRISQLLNVSGLSGRIVSSEGDIDRVLEKIDYSCARERMRIFINHSKEVLDGYCRKA